MNLVFLFNILIVDNSALFLTMLFLIFVRYFKDTLYK